MVQIILRYWLVAAVLAAGGIGLYALGGLQQRAAAAQRQLLTLEFEAPGAELSLLATETGRVAVIPGVATVAGFADTLRAQQATATYWQQRYGELALRTSASGELLEHDPALLLVAANAAYRGASRDEAGPSGVQRLEAVLAQYADILRRGDWQFDAAYNYEYGTRRRDALIKARSARPAERRDLPTPRPNATLHGEPGAVPPGTDMSDFKIVVPQRSDERREQPEAGKGGPKQRKG